MNIKNKKNYKVLKWVIFIFIFAVFWQLFLTAGIDFFWEDFDIFHVYWKKSAEFKVFKERYLPEFIQPSRFTLTLGIGKEFVKNFFASAKLFQIGFNSYSFVDRPYQFLTWDLLKVYFGNKVILYRMFKAMIFAINSCIIFLLINRVSLLLGIFGVLLYMTSAEIWLSILYISHLGPLAQCGVIISMLLFIKLTEMCNFTYKHLLIYYFLIMLTSNFAALSLGDGRYLAIIFFLTLLFFRIKNILIHLIPIAILFFMEFPILGYFKKIFFDWSFSPINLASHNNTRIFWLSSLVMAVRHSKFLVNAIGNKLLIILAVCFVLHLHIWLLRSIFTLFQRNKKVHKNIDMEKKTSVLKERLFLFGLWFFATITMSIRVSSLRYGMDPIHFFLYNLAYFIAPSIIFIIYYIVLIKNNFTKNFRFVFLSLIICLMVIQISSNINRLSKFRERTNEYFCVWQNAKEYVENNSSDALVLAFTKVTYRPFVFLNSNNKVINSDQSLFSDLNFIEKKFKEEKYKDIFVLGMEEINFIGVNKNVALHQKKKIDGDCGDSYDHLKLVVGRGSKHEINLYHFKLKN